MGAITSTILAVAAIAGGAYAASQSHQDAKAQKSLAEGAMDKQNQEAAAMAKLPAEAAATAKATVQKKRAAMARSQSVYTSPLGIAGEASTAKKTLLGQ